MKAAFLVGVSIYDSLPNLPACRKDVSLVESLLKATNNYEQIVTLEEGTKSDTIKSKLRGFAKELVEKSVEEFFIYFSGHGLQEDDEMLLCCSDYDSHRPESTSLSNTEIDELIRLVEPELTVKIIDACQSGFQYIKNADALEKSLSKKSIKKFIFMASSQQQESSFATQEVSYFTESFLNAAVSKELGEDVYYRDIQSYIADTFKDRPRQTPLFVSQITGLEVFANSNQKIKNLKDKYRSLIQEKLKEKSISERVLDAIDETESHYISKEKINSLLCALDPLKLSISFSSELIQKLYTLSVKSTSLEDIGSKKIIAQQVAKKEWSEECFIKLVENPYKFRQPKSILGNFPNFSKLAFNYMTKVEDIEYEIVTRYVVDDIQVTYQMPFECLQLDVDSSKSCLSPWSAFLFVIPARTYSVLTLGFVKLGSTSWDEFSLDPSEIEWNFEKLSWRDWDTNSPINILVDQVEKRLEQDIELLTGLPLNADDKIDEESSV